jgi:indole-3-glycerol phosphate synthase
MAQNQKADLLQGLYRASLAQTKRRLDSLSLEELEHRASQQNPISSLDFFRQEELSVIAEIKRASPSKGKLAEIADHLEDLEVVSDGVGIPTLRKDFISTKEQILEAKAYGASMILLIIMGLSAADYQELFDYAESMNLDVLVETHSESEIEIALSKEVRFLGINTRNLQTFTTDIDLFGRLAGSLPDGVIKVAESAVSGVSDAQLYRDHGADAVLVGEALVTGDSKSLIESFRLTG